MFTINQYQIAFPNEAKKYQSIRQHGACYISLMEYKYIGRILAQVSTDIF